MPKSDNSILEGNRRFVRGTFDAQPERFRALLDGQSRFEEVGDADEGRAA